MCATPGCAAPLPPGAQPVQGPVLVPGPGTGGPPPKEMPKATPDKTPEGTKSKEGAALDSVAPVTPVTGSGSPY